MRARDGHAAEEPCHIPTASPGQYLRGHLARVQGTLQELGAGLEELPGRQVVGAAGTEWHQQGEGRCGAGGRTLGDTDMGSRWGRGHRGPGTGHQDMGCHCTGTWRAHGAGEGARDTQGSGTGCHRRGHRGGMWRGMRTLGDPWGCRWSSGVAPRLPTHLNRMEILFSVAAMLYTSSSSRDEAWAGPGVGDTPHKVRDAPRRVRDPRQAGDTLLPMVPCQLPSQHLPDWLFPTDAPSLPAPLMSLQVLVPILSLVLSCLQVPVPSPILESESLSWSGPSNIPGFRSMS